MKIVAIKDMSAGNDTVGEMWKETKIFDDKCALSEVIEWATGGHGRSLNKNVVITVADEKEVEDE